MSGDASAQGRRPAAAFAGALAPGSLTGGWSAAAGRPAAIRGVR